MECREKSWPNFLHIPPSALCLGLLLTPRLKFLDLLMGCMWLKDVEKNCLSQLECTDAYLSEKCHYLKNLLFSTNKI